VERKLIPLIWAMGYSSNLWSRTKGFSLRPGRRLSLIGAGWTNSRNLSVPKTRMNIMREKTRRFRVRIGRISEWDRTAPQGARFEMCGESFGAFVGAQYEQSATSFAGLNNFQF
jgi:hypothetical protein